MSTTGLFLNLLVCKLGLLRSSFSYSAETSPHLTTLSMNPSVAAFSIRVRTFARSNPVGTLASISSLMVTSAPAMVVSCV